MRGDGGRSRRLLTALTSTAPMAGTAHMALMFHLDPAKDGYGSLNGFRFAIPANCACRRHPCMPLAETLSATMERHAGSLRGTTQEYSSSNSSSCQSPHKIHYQAVDPIRWASGCLGTVIVRRMESAGRGPIHSGPLRDHHPCKKSRRLVSESIATRAAG